MFHVERMGQTFDIIVVGGGHAGAEAARSAARGGLRVALITLIRDAIGRMSCNPAIGGLAKGHLVKEIDALGGLMGEAADASGIQFKVLNRSKGPAVHGPRAQCDRDLYAAAVLGLLQSERNVTLIEGSVASIGHAGGRVKGVELADGTHLSASAVIVTTGTFLRAIMHSGEIKAAGGRFGEPSADTLSQTLREFGLKLGRLKTGTPPRIERDSVDFSLMDEAPGDEEPRPFSILTTEVTLPQVLCHLTYTTEATHELIRANLHRAPMYSGQIESAGPRYCPSIEDKVVRFADKERHQIFVEPEGLTTTWLYLNGISTSLPPDVQEGVVRSLPGMEHARIARYGYAVEYDFVNPEQLEATLQVRGVEGLYLAGQINGTSGYEEAAAQGLMAGINALLRIRGEGPLILRRDQGYIGVMIDDLVTLGTEEPYRMFTSRAEHRLLLGCDSVYERLTPIGKRLGILDGERLERAERRVARMSEANRSLESAAVHPDRETLAWLEKLDVSLNEPTTVARLFQRHDLDPRAMLSSSGFSRRFPDLAGTLNCLTSEELDGVLSRTRYSGYIEKQAREAEKMEGDEAMSIPPDFSYRRPGLSREVVEKLEYVRPASLGQAARVRGVTPAAISILRIHLKHNGRPGDGRHSGEARAL
ncbi:MAG TPA: tRNA uridine-5-carboxymethylaminomethyl(34) synthesis enzyme MnmG [Thermoanaerobaculia bacterium]|nr:tRNA uridine-5-carboxymethylaminomethyl(34) synthesis enzyme MnmG [Thermoanaerobaculia bacterium]